MNRVLYSHSPARSASQEPAPARSDRLLPGKPSDPPPYHKSNHSYCFWNGNARGLAQGWMDVLCTGWGSIGASKQHLSPLATQCTLIATNRLPPCTGPSRATP
jgi:hypothetical protein